MPRHREARSWYARVVFTTGAGQTTSGDNFHVEPNMILKAVSVSGVGGPIDVVIALLIPGKGVTGATTYARNLKEGVVRGPNFTSDLDGALIWEGDISMVDYPGTLGRDPFIRFYWSNDTGASVTVKIAIQYEVLL